MADLTTELLSTPNPPPDDYEVVHGYAIFLPIVIVVTVVMNMGTITAFYKMPSLRENPSELLILNLACSDLLTGSIVLPLASPSYITPNQWPMGEIGCAIWVFFIDLSIHGTLFALMTISLDRFLLVYLEYPQYIKTVTRKRIYRVIASGWLIASLTGVIEMAFWERAKGFNDTAGSIDHSKICLSPPRRVRSFAMSFFFVLYFLSVILVCMLSVAFLYQLRLRLKRTKAMTHKLKESSHESKSDVTDPETTTDKSSSSQQNTNVPKLKKGTHAKVNVRNRYIKPGITLVGLVFAMAICMLPYSLYVLYSDIAPALGECHDCSDPVILYGLLLMQFCNACLDPFIYVLTRKRIRTFYRTCFKRRSVY